MSETDMTAQRPFWLGPLGPFVLATVSLVFLFQDGLTPYSIIYKRTVWDHVPAMPAKVTVPYMRTTLRAGLSDVNRTVAEGERSALGARERGRHKGRSSSGRGDGLSNTTTREEMYQKRVMPDPIHSEYITKGVGTKYTVRRWYIRLSFEYFYNGQMYSVHEDEPLFSFDSREAAESFLRKHADEWPIKVWVNPGDPGDATAFLLYDKWHWVQLGAVLAFFSIIWFVIAGVGGRQFRMEAQKGSSEAD